MGLDKWLFTLFRRRPAITKGQHGQIKQLVGKARHPDDKEVEIPGPSFRVEHEDLLPEIQAVTDLPQPYDWAKVQQAWWLLHHTQQNPCDGNVSQRPQKKQKHESADSRYAKKSWGEYDRSKHRPSKPCLNGWDP